MEWMLLHTTSSSLDISTLNRKELSGKKKKKKKKNENRERERTNFVFFLAQ